MMDDAQSGGKGDDTHNVTAPTSTAPLQRRIGVFGGSFDPIHVGHLVMAEAARERLSLDRVLFVPVAVQPLKQGRPVKEAGHRVAMVTLAVAGNPHFALSTIEVDRPGPSYTVDTLRLLCQEFPGSLMWFIVGSDALLTIPRWRDPEGILALARLAVIRRPGAPDDLSAITPELPQLESAIDWVDAPLIGISATDLRLRAAEGLSLRYRVPDTVREYIQTNRLYAAENE